MNNKIKLGIIGFSPGNGHPYSWSAICNGFNKEAMGKCGFPVISRYLEKQSFPGDFISNAKVTHVWTQDKGISKRIASSSNIEFVVDDFRDMIGQVDGILLARDDSETHFYFSSPFLEAGIPIYVDKPLALSIDEAKRMVDLQSYSGQLFSCSALRYAREFKLSDSQILSLGVIKYVIGSTPKNWDKYAIHVIEPMLALFPEMSIDLIQKSRWASNSRVVLHGECLSGLEFEVATMGTCNLPISLRIVGSDNSLELVFSDAFSAFRSALQTFIDLSCQRLEALSADQMLASISILQAGRL